MAKMKIISVQLPQGLINALDVLVRRGVYPNRSEAIREAIRELVKRELYVMESEEREIPEYVVK
ncbi:MAG TPA: ribbon-helix-helix protein, CopG family [Thermococcus sp.]|uniref:Predicted transcriptional regulators containing the CopG/Arc/MetJ DNA-binding domain and a metal-binding domain n=2 Tax=Thermococcus sibiricus TaxID=172049 RepID=C6A437_THESM|nr:MULTISPECIES: ribbon-helix-helix domain-containing protein [Thermococcus]RLF74964.1 MAG: ribbon-helix-helix protein, CopG family [Thermococci archaeon]ACS90382.1 Predicted transcriptional regulators containing the CopG/Arc/MetJ DNA- binding domain and a metal-binding domain [Thermococcus sibiricus MM 739]KUK17252.1 MAG: transcriptional regulator [Thermococcus sibiricus]MBC7094835.1 ribbon-helix-helix protein, CopG family [Thermococcus sp.]MCD6140479.1 ribbon-helix-helix protein, CopG family